MIITPPDCELQHLIPTWDVRAHFTRECCCEPELDESGVMVHNAFDGRERYEQATALHH